MSDEPYPVLANFLACYLNQDWPDEYETAEEAVDAFVKDDPKDVIASAKKEIESLLESDLTERALERLIYSFGCYYNLSYDDRTPREWLQMIARRLDRTNS